MNEKSEKKAVALNVDNHPHFTEHLAPLCTILGIPLLFTNENRMVEARRMYPGLDTVLGEWDTITPQSLIENYDILFQSQPWDRKEFYTLFQPLEKLYNKTIRNVHCPHGFSDKVIWLQNCVDEDITLVYGQSMLDMFTELGIEQRLNAYVRTGNYRYAYYLQHQSFFDQLIETEILSSFSHKKPLILYAPTNNDQQHSTSFLESSPLFETLPSDYNLIVKLHPSLEETDPATIYRLMAKYEKKGSILFIKEMPLIFPLLARTDIYIGDMSSIGYDFLVFNRPQYFLNRLKPDPKLNRNFALYRCGVEINPHEYHNIFSIIEKTLPSDKERFSELRKSSFHYAFGEQIPFPQIKENIIKAYSSNKKI